MFLLNIFFVDTLASNNIPLRDTSWSISFIFDQPIINFKKIITRLSKHLLFILHVSTN